MGSKKIAGIGELVLKEMSAMLSALLLQLADVERDRELWAHRFLASRELQQSAALCEQAAQIDQVRD